MFITEGARSFFTEDLSTCFYSRFATAYSEFIKLFLQRFFSWLKWAGGLFLFLLYYRNHVFVNVDRFGSKKRHKRNISFSRDQHSTFSHKGAIAQDTIKIFVISWAQSIVVSFAAVIRVVTQRTAAHSSSAFLSLNWPIRNRLPFLGNLDLWRQM